MHVRRLLAVTAVLTLLASLMVVVPAGAASPGSSTTRQISSVGTTSFQSAPSASNTGLNQPNELSPGLQGAGAVAGAASGPVVNRANSGAASNGKGSAANSAKKSTANPELINSFDALNHRNQRLANGGNQFSLEPPDQGLCVGNGFVLEVINDVTRVYDQNGNPLNAVTDLNSFFGYPPEVNRTTGVFGPFPTPAASTIRPRRPGS